MSREEKKKIRRESKVIAERNGVKVHDWTTKFMDTALSALSSSLPKTFKELLNYFYAQARAACKDDLSSRIIRSEKPT